MEDKMSDVFAAIEANENLESPSIKEEITGNYQKLIKFTKDISNNSSCDYAIQVHAKELLKEIGEQ